MENKAYIDFLIERDKVKSPLWQQRKKVYLHIIKELENKDNALAVASMMNLG